MQLPQVEDSPRCRFLFCKSMMVFGERFTEDPDYQAGLVDFWCTQTTKPYGPDSDLADLDNCSNPERECFREF